MKQKIRIGALISGGGTNLQAIIDACNSGSVDGKLVFVGSDNPDAGGLKRAGQFGVPTFVVDYASILQKAKDNPKSFSPPQDFELNSLISKQHLFPPDTAPEKVAAFLKTRAVAEAFLLEAMQPYPFDLLVLAGFMRTLSPYLIDRVNTDPSLPRIMNIHPALLPSFPGVDGYGDTFKYGCKVGGCTVHYIDYGEDTGPIIGQKAFEIKDGDTLDDVKSNGLKKEWELYPQCIQKYAESL